MRDEINHSHIRKLIYVEAMYDEILNCPDTLVPQYLRYLQEALADVEKHKKDSSQALHAKIIVFIIYYNKNV